MNNRKIEFFVGLFVLAGFAGLLFLAMQAANLSSFSSAKTYTVTANFDNIGGLKPRAPVKTAGVVVGRVGPVTFDNASFQAHVQLFIDSRYKFPTDSSAKILTSGLLGEQYIGLEPGGDEEDLADGGRITVTQSAMVLENLISKFLFDKAEEAGSDGAK